MPDVIRLEDQVARDMMDADESKTVDQLSNHEIVTLALYLCGGQLHAVDTEDVAIKAHEVAPGRFTWRRYPAQISLDAVRKRLWDAQSPEKGFCYVAGSERTGWTIAPAGQKFVQEHLAAVGVPATPRKRLSVDEKRWVTRERTRLLDQSAVRKVLGGMPADVTRREAEMAFRLDDYVTGEARKRKVDRMLNLLGGDEQLGPAIHVLAKILLIQPDS